MAKYGNTYGFIKDNFDKYDEKVEFKNIVYSNHEFSPLCKTETYVKYSNRKSDLYCTKPFKRDIFLEKFRKVSREYMKNGYLEFNNLEVINQISHEYESFIDMMCQEDGQITLINDDDFNSDCLAKFFVRVLKMLGFIVKKKPRSDSDTSPYTDVFVQLMFIKGHENEDKYFYLIYSRQPCCENGFEMVVLDDFIFKSIIQTLIKNIEELPNIDCSYSPVDWNFPNCFKVIKRTYSCLLDFVNHFSSKCKNFIFI